MNSPILPPELCHLVISHLADLTTLRVCSLVSHGWLPATRRSLFPHLRISDDDLDPFMPLLSSEYNTFLSAVIAIHFVSWPHHSTVLSTVFPHLAQFTRLTTVILEIHEPLEQDLPVVPDVTSLQLCIHESFSFPQFLQLLSPFPSLKRLHVSNVTWDWEKKDSLSSISPLPPLHELVLSTFFFEDASFREWLAQPSTTITHLTLYMGYSTDSIVDGVLHLLHSLRTNLQHLHVDCTCTHEESLARTYGFDKFTDLQTLHISG
ncbi:hypothetical protein FB45DRAFT_1096118 [Roridomyces roridus]|uniref:F-box domain-containing protein n=1 Tax=Roridomyces roridus TaxID=1738132 RepID=A0AAD7BFV0_9AGAR|nr:hypothetical protein FB45DRAFT_1096118 [Roridomyces roridus]